jgi:putative flippase GtrA
MALAQNRLVAAVWDKLRTKVGVRFTRFMGVALASLLTAEIALTLCNGVFHMTATPAALISTFAGAVVSYVLSRWAWERKGKPDILRETLPFWVISAMVWAILWLATKLGYHMASWLGLHGFKHVLLVDLVYLVANFVTFLLRFVIFHYVLFAEPATAARVAATGPDAIPPGAREVPSASEAPHSAAPAATAEVTLVSPATETTAGYHANGDSAGTSASRARLRQQVDSVNGDSGAPSTAAKPWSASAD